MKQFTLFALILVVCCLRGLAQDGGTETRPYLYQEDFEQADPSKPFHSVACTVNCGLAIRFVPLVNKKKGKERAFLPSKLYELS